MKVVKSLLLGTAAGLIAVGGAQAADLPVKAKAVEYVKICSLYGAGFYYIPGTDTCIKLGGYLRAEVALNAGGNYSAAYNGASGANNRLTNYYSARAREDLNIDTRTATEYGVVRTYFDAVFTWTTDNYTATARQQARPFTRNSAKHGRCRRRRNNASSGTISGGTLGVYYAFIQFAGFTMGKSVSQFDAPWTNYPGNNFDQLVGGSGSVNGVEPVHLHGRFRPGHDRDRFGAGPDPVLHDQHLEHRRHVHQRRPRRCLRLQRYRRHSVARHRRHGSCRPGLGPVPGVGGCARQPRRLLRRVPKSPVIRKTNGAGPFS